MPLALTAHRQQQGFSKVIQNTSDPKILQNNLKFNIKKKKNLDIFTNDCHLLLSIKVMLNIKMAACKIMHVTNVIFILCT